MYYRDSTIRAGLSANLPKLSSSVGQHDDDRIGRVGYATERSAVSLKGRGEKVQMNGNEAIATDERQQSEDVTAKESYLGAINSTVEEPQLRTTTGGGGGQL